MTYEQYWHGDVQMVRAYREADRLKQERQNSEAWLQGMYFYDALASITSGFSKKGGQREYPQRPYALGGDVPHEETEAEKEKREEQEALRARVYMDQMVWAGKNWGKK